MRREVWTNGRIDSMTTAGEGEGPGLLVVHGWNASRRFFDQVLSDLAADRRVAIPDLLGFGDAPKPSRRVALEDLADDALDAADRAGLRRFAVLGHSMGAAVGILIAERAAQRVESLILSNGLVHGATALVPLHRAIATPPLRQLAFALRPVRTVRRWISVDFARIERRNRAAARDLLRGTYRILSSTLDSILAADLENRLRALPVPVGILWSRDDGQLSRDQFERQRRARPDAPVRALEWGGHCPMIERPREYAVAVRELLRETASESSRGA
jgi:pimeloyl-ACP methyl ester carboxylesterase